MPTMTCNYCGATMNGTITEVLSWDKRHDEYCTGKEES